MEYTPEKLDEIAQNILSGIDKELEDEKELDEMSSKIAEQIRDKGKVTEVFQGTRYKWWFEEKHMIDSETNKKVYGYEIFCYNLNRAEIVFPKVLLPAKAFIPFEDKRMDRLTCLATGIKALLRHKMGKDITMGDD